jgi:hypothetical protein
VASEFFASLRQRIGWLSAMLASGADHTDGAGTVLLLHRPESCRHYLESFGPADSREAARS